MARAETTSVRSTPTTVTKKRTKPAYKKLILKILQKENPRSRKGVSRQAIYSHIDSNYEIKSVETMRKSVSKRLKELQADKVIATLKQHPHSFKLTQKGRKSMKKKPRTGGRRTSASRAARAPRSSAVRSSLFGARSGATKQQPECLFSFKSNERGTGIYVNQRFVFMGTSNGKVYILDRISGEVKKTLQFDSAVQCIIGDQSWLYVGLITGEIYDCSTSSPRLMFKYEKNEGQENNQNQGGMNQFGAAARNSSSIEWMDIRDGYLAIDAKGTAGLLNLEGDLIWKNEGFGTNRFVRADANSVYHCRGDNVSAYTFLTGELKWTTHGGSCVTFGSEDEENIYTAPYEVRQINKETGETTKKYFGNTPWAVATNFSKKDDEPNQIFTSDCSSLIFCYDKESTSKQWVTPTRGGRGESLQYYDGKLYCVTSDGVLSAFDVNNVSEEHSEGQQIQASSAPTAVAPSNEVESTSDRSGGVLVVTVKEGSKMRVRVDPSEDDSFDKSLNIQFPRNLRSAEGLQYVVEELVLNDAGTFYRSRGEIKAYSG